MCSYFVKYTRIFICPPYLLQQYDLSCVQNTNLTVKALCQNIVAYINLNTFGMAYKSENCKTINETKNIEFESIFKFESYMLQILIIDQQYITKLVTIITYTSQIFIWSYITKLVPIVTYTSQILIQSYITKLVTMVTYIVDFDLVIHY